MIRYLHQVGFKFNLVLANSLYEESHSTFIRVLNEFQLKYAVAICSNHAVWLPQSQSEKIVMTKILGIKFQEVGNLYGLRNWIEYGLKPSENELGWADFRFTDYSQIQKWWELVMSAYLMFSLHSKALSPSRESGNDSVHLKAGNITSKFATQE